jgi:AcrR family transcriptional regulator
MARPKSEDKRNAILSAATEVFAERGLSAATSAISSAAGVAEGTLFTYFKTKDELINALYREIKLELADAMMSDFPRRAGIRDRLQHVWNHYLAWGVKNPSQHKVLQQMTVWGGLTEGVEACRDRTLPGDREDGRGRGCAARLSRPPAGVYCRGHERAGGYHDGLYAAGPKTSGYVSQAGV